MTKSKNLSVEINHSRDLLLALSRAAQSVQRARTEEDVYHAVGDQIKSLGAEAVLYIVVDEQRSLALAHTTYATEVVKKIEKLFGEIGIGYHIKFAPDTVYAKSLESGRTAYVHWTKEDIASVLPESFRPLAAQLVRLLKIRQEILAPLRADEEELGLLIVNGPALTGDDVPAIESFAAQIAISLRNVRLTQRMQMELAARRKAEENLRLQSAALEAAANAIAITDRTGIIQWVNPAWEKLTGYTREESVGRNPSIVRSGSHHPQFYKDLWDRILAGEVWQGEMINRRKDGSIYFEEQTITPVLDEQGDLTHFIAIKQDITERKESEAALERLAQTDSLTGIHNRRRLFELAGHEFDLAHRYGHALSIVMFDLDHFKEVNDTFGHVVGDQMLKHVAEIARSQLRDTDMIGRYGGEEFMLVLPMTEARQALLLVDRIHKSVELMRIETEKGTASITLSAGIAGHSPLDASVEDIIRRADQALYAAKQAGRNRTLIFESETRGGA